MFFSAVNGIIANITSQVLRSQKQTNQLTRLFGKTQKQAGSSGGRSFLHTNSYRKLSSEEAINMSNRFLAPNYEQVIDTVVEYAQGPFVINPEGKKWFDLNSAYGAANFGHGRTEIIEVEHEQAKKAALPSRAYYNDILPLVAQKLHGWYHPILQPTDTATDVQFMPKNTGGEATDAAIKLMRKAGHDLKGVKDGNQLVIVFNRNFHGRPITVVSASDDPTMRRGFGPLTPGFLFCDFNDERGLDKIFSQYDSRICGAMIEYVQGEGGVHVATEPFMNLLRSRLSESGALLVADDVQTGWGRTGALSPSEYYPLAKPDCVLFAKSCTGGISPVSGLVARSDWMKVMSAGTEGSTYGGNPKSMAAMLATMDLFEQQHMATQLGLIGGRLKSLLEKLAKENLRMKEVRGLGAMLAVEWQSAEDGLYYKKRLHSIGRLMESDIEGVSLKMTEEGRTMRINPSVMSDDELALLGSFIKCAFRA